MKLTSYTAATVLYKNQLSASRNLPFNTFGGGLVLPSRPAWVT